jgi:hypothetical protein
MGMKQKIATEARSHRGKPSQKEERKMNHK